MRSERLYDTRYRPRPRRSPVGAIAGLLIVALITGAVLVGGGTWVGQALVAFSGSGPSASPGAAAIAALPDPSADARSTLRPRRTPPPGGRPPATVAPRETSAAPAAPAADPGDALPSRRPHGPDGPGAEDIAAGADPSADPATTPTATPHPWADLRPRPRRGPFAMDIYRDGAMAPEATPEWCVPAAMLTMINLVKKKRRPITSYEEQKRLYALARRHSTDKLTGAGAEPEGWAEGLNREGIGPYVVFVAPSRKLAIKQAVKALRLTGRPVGILAWRGAHSMVLTGFKATADPAWTNDYEVTDVVIADVWWPRVSSIWGRSLPPGSSESVERLAEDFLPWRRPGVAYPFKDDRFVLVLPVRDDGRYNPKAD